MRIIETVYERRDSYYLVKNADTTDAIINNHQASIKRKLLPRLKPILVNFYQSSVPS